MEQAQTPTNASQQHTDDAFDTLYKSLKVVAHTDCPLAAHFTRAFCSCPVALASLKPNDIFHCKVKNFMRWFDVQLLAGCEAAFDYVGEWDLPSQRTFTEKEGKTPQQFARWYLQEGPMHEMFAPKFSVGDTVQAMLEYWAWRNAKGKAQYGTREKAYEQWIEKGEGYGEEEGVRIPLSSIDHDPKIGEPIPTNECWYGPPDHRCMSHIYVGRKVGEHLEVVQLDGKRCHANCPVMGDQQVKECVDQFAARIFSQRNQ